jgi:chromosome segregation ATPase
MVSDNYSKFISSIDIVKKMKESIEGVEKKMEKLETSVNKINDLAVKVDSTLETKRTEIKKLDMINKDLSGLRKLWEFPDLLKKELNQYKVFFGRNFV